MEIYSLGVQTGFSICTTKEIYKNANVDYTTIFNFYEKERFDFPLAYKWCYDMGINKGLNAAMYIQKFGKGEIDNAKKMIKCSLDEMIEYEQNLYSTYLDSKYNVEPDIENNIKPQFQYNIEPDIENNIKPQYQYNQITVYNKKRKCTQDAIICEPFVPNKKLIM